MSEAKATKPTIKERLQDHVKEYGSIALVIFFSIFALTLLGFYIAIKAGMDVGDSTAGSSGTLFAAWVATKITLPLRIGGTFVLTPIAAALIHKVKGKPSAAGSVEDEDETESAEDEDEDEDESAEDGASAKSDSE